MPLSPVLIDSVALNVLALFFQTTHVHKKMDELEGFINGISKITDAKELIFYLLSEEYLFRAEDSPQIVEIGRKGKRLYDFLGHLSNISISASR